MRVGIDCSLAPGRRTGIGEYCYQLVHALSRIDHETQYLLYPIFFYVRHPDYQRVDLPETSNMQVTFRHAPRLWVRLLRHPHSPGFLHERFLGPVDIVHSTSFAVPRLRNGRRRLVMTIYDLSFLVHPEFHQEENVRHALQGTREAIARADAVIAISHSTRQELIDRLNMSPSRIVVTPLAAASHYVRVEDAMRVAQVREKYNLSPHFILCVGTLEPRKNIARLLEAYAQLAPSLRNEIHMVVAGGTGWLNENIYPIVHRFGLDGRVHFLGYVEERDLPVIYSLATVFAYPSLYEGFGLPILEAMQCGTPVLTSNISALPEVAGDAALLVSPTSVEEIADGLTRLLEDNDLRTALCTRGIERAGQFSWERCAQETLAVYQQCR